MSQVTDRQTMETLFRRIDFLACLEDGPHHKADLVEDLEYSRSTVHRAIAELETVGFVERAPRGYVLTHSGQFVLEQYRTFRSRTRWWLEAQPVVDAIAHSCSLPSSIHDSTVSVVDGPYAFFGTLTDVLEDVERYRVVLPELVDERHVRLWHTHVVSEGRTVDVVTTNRVLERLADAFPVLTSELAESDRFSAYSSRPHDVGFVLTGTTPAAETTASVPTATAHTDEASTDAVALVSYDGAEPAGILTTTNAETVAWADAQYEQLRRDSTDATDILQSTRLDDSGSLSAVFQRSLPPAISTEGFVDLDDIEPDHALTPTQSWQFGLGLAEVATGQALERQQPDGQTLSEAVLEQLRTGTNVAVLGPAGSGKSTLCKQVAWRFLETCAGRVLYRESDRGDPIDSVSVLIDFVRRATDPLLVVVEDVVRPDAAAMFEVMRAVADCPTVTFLFDARTNEWHDPPTPLTDPHLDAYRRESVDLFSMPPLESDELERLLHDSESILETTIDVSSETFLETTSDSVDEPRPGTMLLLGHQLATAADPLPDERGVTTLEADVDTLRSDLKARGQLALDVGILANALNAAGVELAPELLFALALEGSSTDTPNTDTTAVEQVSAALERLEGHVLVSSHTDRAYRGIHESWSVTFLERLLETEGERTASERFGRCLTSVLTLADEPTRCDRLTRTVSGRSSGLDGLLAAPGAWADTLAQSVFDLGLTNATLAPLYGLEAASTVELPEACSARTRRDCLERHGRMLLRHGNYEAAARVFERLERRAIDRDDSEGEATARWWQGEVAQWQGRYDVAREHYQRSHTLAEAIDDRTRQAAALKGLGNVTYRQDEYESARTYYEQSLELAQAIGDRQLEARNYNNLAALSQRAGEYETTCEYGERGLAIYRAIGDQPGEADTLLNLGVFNEHTGSYAQALEYYEQSLEIYQTVGDRQGMSITLGNLAVVAEKRGQFDRARTYLERSLAIARETGDRNGELTQLNVLGAVERQTGHLDRARSSYREALELARDIENRYGEAASQRGLAHLARLEGAYDEAKTHLETSRKLYDTIDSQSGLAKVDLEAATLAFERRHYDRARNQVERARTRFEALEEIHWSARCRRLGGRIAAATGDTDTATEQFESALETFTTLDAPHDALAVLENAIELADSRGDDRRRCELCEYAHEQFTAAPEPVKNRNREWLERRC